MEILISTSRIRECVADEYKSREIRDALADGHVTYGMQTFDQSLMQLYSAEQITYETALNAATNPDDFALHVRGISGTSDATFSMDT